MRPADGVLGLAGAELAEVLCGFGNDVFEELKGDAAEGFAYERSARAVLHAYERTFAGER